MFNTLNDRVEHVLRGGVANQIPFTIYASHIPQCAAERRLRNMGLYLVRRDVNVIKPVMPNVKMTSTTYQEEGKTLVRTDYETPAGHLHAIDEPSGLTAWHHKWLFETPEDYKALRAMVDDTQYVADYDTYAAAQADEGGDSLFRGAIGYEPMQMIISAFMGTETFCIEWCDRQDEVIKLYEAVVQERRREYELLADSPCLSFNYGGNVTPEIIGLERFERYYLAHYNEAAETLHRKGKLLYGIIKNDKTEHDSYVHHDDALKVFVWEPKQSILYRMYANSIDTTHDSHVTLTETDQGYETSNDVYSWESGWATKSLVDNDGWYVEAVIPFADLSMTALFLLKIFVGVCR